MVDRNFYSRRAMRAARSSTDAVSPSSSVSSILMPSNPGGVNLDTVSRSAESSLKSKRDCASPYAHAQRKKSATMILACKSPLGDFSTGTNLHWEKGKRESRAES